MQKVEGSIYKKQTSSPFDKPQGRYPSHIPSILTTADRVEVKVDGQYYIIWATTTEEEN